MTKSVLMTS